MLHLLGAVDASTGETAYGTMSITTDRLYMRPSGRLFENEGSSAPYELAEKRTPLTPLAAS